MAKGKKQTIRESDLLKALNEFEELVEKGSSGDAMLDQDPEGGLSSEGTPLSNKAPSGKSKNGEMAKMLSASDIGDDDEDAHKKRMKRVAKAETPDESSDEDEEDEPSEDADDESEVSEDEDEEPPPVKKGLTKSFRERAEQDETIQKGLEVSDFLEALIDQSSNALSDLQKAIVHLDAATDAKLAKSMADQREFNIGLAKAVVAVGHKVDELAEMMKSFGGQPHVPQRRAVLSKSEIVQPFGGAGDSSDIAAGSADLEGLTRESVQDWLVQKASENKIDPLMVTMFEQNGYNPNVLPIPLRKALVNDLLK